MEEDVKHGTFTNIAYAAAWITAILGTIGGVLAIISGLNTSSYNGGEEMVGVGVAIIISSWIGASGVGTLSEISRKLSYSEMVAKKTLNQDG